MLKVNGLVKNYGDFTLNCTMKVEPGRITGLVGENGAGKTTLFKSVLGLISSDGGRISLMGKAPAELTEKEKEKIGAALAESGFSGYLKIKDIVPVLAAMYPAFEKGRFLRLCGKLKLPQDKYIKEFSTGMKAKLKVLVAVTHGASFLLMDEPTTGLDVMTRNEVLDLLREAMEADENRSILIHDGQIILHEETDTLLNEYGLIKADERQFAGLDKEHILRVKKEMFGYACLTNQRQYYMENYPELVVEKGNLDEVITMMSGGKEL